MFAPCSFIHPSQGHPPVRQSTPALRCTDQGGAAPPQVGTGESARRWGQEDPVLAQWASPPHLMLRKSTDFLVPQMFTEHLRE